MRLLVIAPHADDAEFGCGGTIARMVEQGHDVVVRVMSLAEKLVGDARRKEECLRAMKILGVRDVKFRVYPVMHREFFYYRQLLLDDFIALNREYSPELVIIPQTGDFHQDHQVVNAEAIRVFRSCTLLGYDMPWSNHTGNVRYFVPLLRGHVDIKYEALQSYDSVKDRPYMDKEYIYGLAKIRGVQCGEEYAEAFEPIKIIGGDYALGGNGEPGKI